MSILSWWRERRRWRTEMKDMPLHQLRGMVERYAYHQNPEKQQWAEWWLWRREKLWGHPIALTGLAVAMFGPIIGWIGVRYGLF
jgi:hypothetical protein